MRRLTSVSLVLAFIFSGLVVLPYASTNVSATDSHLDYGGWEWHFDDTSDATKAVLTRVVWVSGSTEINIPEHLFGSIDISAIAAACFWDSEGEKITKVLSMPSTITSIGEYAFRGCIITSCVIGSGVITIGDSAFANCYYLTSLTIPNSVTTLGLIVFSYAGLTSITIPAGITSIGALAFSGCNALTAITVDASNPAYTNNAGDGVLYNKTITSLIRYPPARTGTSFSIPNGVTLIGAGAFNAGSSLVSIDIPNSVSVIETNAFFGCNALTSIIIPEGVTRIEHSTLEQCRHLVSVTLPNSLTYIGIDAFWEDDVLASITIPNNVTTIEHNAFYMCIGLTSVVLGSSLTTIGVEAFSLCTSLDSITFMGLVAPTDVGADWIVSAPVTITGHAYADSNFPSPGNDFNGLTMGAYNSEIPQSAQEPGLFDVFLVLAVTMVLIGALNKLRRR